MPNRTCIAVIILNYFGHEDTHACVDSILDQTSEACVFVVDNSADPREWRQLMAAVGHKPGVRIIKAELNLGFARGVNLGLRAARTLGCTRFIVLNNDTVLHPGAWGILTAGYDRFPNSLITPTIQWGDQANRGSYYHPFLGLILTRPISKPKRPWLFYLTGCALAFDWRLLDRVGYFDERFFMYGEDIEFSNRVVRRGFKLVVLEGTLVDHIGSKSSKRASLFYEYHVNRSHLLLCFRLFESRSLGWLSLVLKLPVLLSRCLYRAMSNRSLVPILGFFLAPFRVSIRPRSGC